ncbi:MAG: dTDP-4-dehydrorhamnose 3,5-epimerase [Candidatus Meridianibacter frigidus]|nr:MAG: dTDP-4-dehydrorhamnose 3,5-epimerase [Candidatus Eremiobacteraeota bacterium]
MQVLPTKFAPVKIVVPDVFSDERGYFQEIYSARRYAQAGIDAQFVQDNVSFSRKGVLRGMHYDWRISKLVQVLRGRVFDVFVNMDESSPTYKQWDAVELSADNHRQVFLPPGFAHGFLTLSDKAVVAYKQTAHYDPAHERGISWCDPAVGIDWPLLGSRPILSSKDASL